MAESSRRRVDFPLPDGPSTAVKTPLSNSHVTPRSARTSPVVDRYVRETSTHRATNESPPDTENLRHTGARSLPRADPSTGPSNPNCRAEEHGGKGHG